MNLVPSRVQSVDTHSSTQDLLFDTSFLTPSHKHLFAKVQLKESAGEEDLEMLGLAQTFQTLNVLVEDRKSSHNWHQ
jgi:hypothetical protein